VRDFRAVDAVRYVNSDGHHLAFRVMEGTGAREVVLFTPGGTIPMEFLERDRVGAWPNTESHRRG
jgi:hypothetical protein